MIDADITSAEVVVPCPNLEASLAFYVESLGFQILGIFPADGPRVAILTGYGLRLRLDAEIAREAGALLLRVRSPEGGRDVTAPEGTRILRVPETPDIVLPPLAPAFSVCRTSEADAWKTGRAGMRYRDLIPGRQGGLFIASHIHIPEAGPVPDYVHYHDVRFQMIYCHSGWVRVVYEDQGPPFVMQTGDSVLQPPGIRHRVLECSADLQVIEIGSPAEHWTHADPDLELPAGALQPERDFGGQRFVFHRASKASWTPWRRPGFAHRDLGIGPATGGLAGARVLRPEGERDGGSWSHSGELLFAFVLKGTLELTCEGHGVQRLAKADACVIPPGLGHAFTAVSEDLEVLEVTLPETP